MCVEPPCDLVPSKEVRQVLRASDLLIKDFWTLNEGNLLRHEICCFTCMNSIKNLDLFVVDTRKVALCECELVIFSVFAGATRFLDAMHGGDALRQDKYQLPFLTEARFMKFYNQFGDYINNRIKSFTENITPETQEAINIFNDLYQGG